MAMHPTQKRSRRKTGLLAGFSALLVLVILFFAFVALVNARTAPQPEPEPTVAEADPLQAERDTVRALLAGYPLKAYNQLNERLLLTLLIEALDTPFDTLALGSSRVLQVNSTVADAGSFYNCGVSGADYRDIMTTFYRFEKAGKLPGTVIIGLDAWLLSPSPEALTARSDDVLFRELLTERLGYDADWLPPGYASAPPDAPKPEDIAEANDAPSTSAPAAAESGTTEAEPTPDDTEAAADGSFFALLDLARFAENLPAFFAGDAAASATDSSADAAETPWVPDESVPVVQGDPYQQHTEVKLPDGQALYTVDYRMASGELVEQKAEAQAHTFIRMNDYYAPDAEQCELFHRFIQYVQACGVEVVFLLTPYHPTVYTYATEYADQYTGFFQTEPWFTWYARQYDIPLYGSYNPTVTQTYGDAFYDGLHIKSEAIQTFFPGVRAIGSALAEGTPATSHWLQTGERVNYTAAEAIVRDKYDIPAPEATHAALDVAINGALCHVVARYAEDGATLLARYAVSRTEGIIYRWDTQLGAWEIDRRFNV